MQARRGRERSASRRGESGGRRARPASARSQPALRAGLAVLMIAALGPALAGCSGLFGLVAGAPGGAAGTGGGTSVYVLGVGDCFDDPPPGGLVQSVPVIPCERPHDNEVYALFDLDGHAFPGASTVLERSEKGCRPRLDAFLGTGASLRGYDFSYLHPTEDSWQRGDREVVCFAFAADRGKLTGSAKARPA